MSTKDRRKVGAGEINVTPLEDYLIVFKNPQDDEEPAITVDPKLKDQEDKKYQKQMQEVYYQMTGTSIPQSEYEKRRTYSNPFL